MRAFMIGDVVGRPGRDILRRRLPALRSEREIDFVVANGENAAGGAGITPKVAEELLRNGVDVVTTGNHVYRHRQIMSYLNGERPVIKPINFAARGPGRGVAVREDGGGRRVAVLNLLGRVFMPPADDPFAAVEDALEEVADDADVILVDLHAEATSEKVAMGWHLDGRVAVMAGTHTHIPTADERVLPGGTAYVTDLGMTGPHDSCLGIRKSIILKNFITGVPMRFDVAAGDVRLQGLLVDVDDATGLATGVERLEERLT